MNAQHTDLNKQRTNGFSWLPKFNGFGYSTEFYFKMPIVLVFLVCKFAVGNFAIFMEYFFFILLLETCCICRRIFQKINFNFTSLFSQNTLDGMQSNTGSNLSPNLLENASKPEWNRLSLDSLQELKNRIFSQGLGGVEGLTAKNPFLPGLPYLHRAAQFPIVPPSVPFDTAAAFSYLAQMTATANAIHSMPDSNAAVAAAMAASQIKKEKSITPPLNHRMATSATPSPSQQQTYDNSDAPLNLSKPKQSFNHLGRSVSFIQALVFVRVFLCLWIEWNFLLFL